MVSLALQYQRSIMYATIFITTLAFIFTTAHNVDHISVGKHGKTYPGQTFLDKDGQYLRLIGPVYAKLKVIEGLKFPLRYWKKLNISGSITPTVEISSFFVNGVIKFNGEPFYTFNADDDNCLIGGLKGGCPYLPGVRIYKEISFTFGDLGLFPGWYEGGLDAYTTDRNQQKFKVCRLEFKLKVLKG